SGKSTAQTAVELQIPGAATRSVPVAADGSWQFMDVPIADGMQMTLKEAGAAIDSKQFRIERDVTSGWLSGMALDAKQQRVYMLDRMLKQISVVDLASGKRSLLKTTQQQPILLEDNPVDVALDPVDGKLMVVDANAELLKSIDLQNGSVAVAFAGRQQGLPAGSFHDIHYSSKHNEEYSINTGTGSVYGYSPATGKVRSVTVLQQPSVTWSAFTVDESNDRLLVVGTGGTLWAVDLVTGNTIKVFDQTTATLLHQESLTSSFTQQLQLFVGRGFAFQTMTYDNKRGLVIAAYENFLIAIDVAHASYWLLQDGSAADVTAPFLGVDDLEYDPVSDHLYFIESNSLYSCDPQGKVSLISGLSDDNRSLYFSLIDTFAQITGGNLFVDTPVDLTPLNLPQETTIVPYVVYGRDVASTDGREFLVYDSVKDRTLWIRKSEKTAVTGSVASSWIQTQMFVTTDQREVTDSVYLDQGLLRSGAADLMGVIRAAVIIPDNRQVLLADDQRHTFALNADDFSESESAFQWPGDFAPIAMAYAGNRLVALSKSGQLMMFPVDSTGPQFNNATRITGYDTSDLAPARGLAISADGKRALITSSNARALLEIDLTTGQRTEISGPHSGTGDGFSNPGDVMLMDPNTAYVVDQQGLIVVDLPTGDRVILH
ncbi:MAG TPA: hypothetical protein VMH83_11900, partial [Candidatus Acidoferrum sp.]|nr:hypothetical protein [Candidatus Acidoferrum sp.]